MYMVPYAALSLEVCKKLINYLFLLRCKKHAVVDSLLHIQTIRATIVMANLSLFIYYFKTIRIHCKFELLISEFNGFQISWITPERAWTSTKRIPMVKQWANVYPYPPRPQQWPTRSMNSSISSLT